MKDVFRLHASAEIQGQRVGAFMFITKPFFHFTKGSKPKVLLGAEVTYIRQRLEHVMVRHFVDSTGVSKPIDRETAAVWREVWDKTSCDVEESFRFDALFRLTKDFESVRRYPVH